ncbi:MAG: hypothetical protein QNJ98_11265 [Planctomycetota bacterium]|nr:hypothetical protein [Planctomycetota bacterium]
MKRYLPPLVLLLVLGAVAVRVAMRPGCDDARERLRERLVDRSTHAETLKELETHLETCSGVTDRWFAAEAYFQAGRYADALKRVWSDPQLAAQPDADRRFGQIGLEQIGWHAGDARRPRSVEAETDALLALVDVGVPWAVAQLESYARTRPLGEVTPYFFRASRFGSPRPLEAIVRGFRSHVTQVEGDRRSIELAAAFSAMRAEAYPEREADLALLIDALRRLRTTNPDAWAASALALGRSETPRALDALREAVASLEKAGRKREVQDLALVRCGLLAGGDWTQYETLKPMVELEAPHPFTKSWYLEALLHRYARGDPEARIPLGDVWLFFSEDDRAVRLRIATALLMQDALPPIETERQRSPVERMVRDLLVSNIPEGRVLALSYQMRVGAPDARARLLDLLTRIAGTWEADTRTGDALRPAFVLGLRALMRHGGTG